MAGGWATARCLDGRDISLTLLGIAQLGAPAEVWRRPASPSVARFLGHDALVDVTVRSGRAVTPLGDVDVEGADGPATLLIRPDALSLGEGRDAVVVASRFAGGSHRLTVEAGGIVAELTAPEHHPPGTTVAVRVDPSGVVRL